MSNHRFQGIGSVGDILDIYLGIFRERLNAQSLSLSYQQPTPTPFLAIFSLSLSKIQNSLYTRKTHLLSRVMISTSPTKCLLHKIHIPSPLTFSDHPPHIITETPAPANTHAHCSHLILHFCIDKHTDIRSPRKHLHSRTRRVDLFGVSWTRDKEHDFEAVASTIHG